MLEIQVILESAQLRVTKIFSTHTEYAVRKFHSVKDTQFLLFLFSCYREHSGKWLV